MKLAVLSDIHANLEALTACLAHARQQGAEAWAFTGDLVGYGADPHPCLAVVRELAQAGALVVRGNHDEAVLGGLCADMGFVAREAAVWSRGQIDDADRAFLAALPYAAEGAGALFVHATADRPEGWEYITGTQSAQRCLAATDARLVFAGHGHRAMLYFSARGRLSAFLPRPGVALTLGRGRRWLALAGSVGQPRDGHPAACYLLFDGESRRLTYHRVAYDWLTAAAKIRAAGLPEMLAQRLEHGQ
jgi:diadenosine tetraphosphatase ApaH/serine/threonine PP2A family protein phosphatase